MLAVLRRELRAMFVSPLAWSILAVVQVLMAYSFLRLLQAFADSQGRLQGLPGAPGLTRLVAMPLFEVAAFVMMLVVPLITMRLVAEERRTGTLVLLLGSPVSSTGIVIGKFLSAMVFVLCFVGLSAAMPLSLLVSNTLDLGLLGAGVFAMTLLGAAFVAVGLYMSTLTSQPTIAAISTFGVLLFAWLLDWGGERETLLTQLSSLQHYRSMLQGVVDTRDIAYFLIVTSVFVILAARRFEASRQVG